MTRTRAWHGLAPRLAFLGIWLLGTHLAHAAAIDLSLADAVGAPYAVSSGIPFPRGAVTSLAQLRLEDAAGRELPAQFESLARWPDGSQKSVLLIVNVEPSSGPSNFRLHYGAGVSRSAVATRLAVTEDTGAITVDTGRIRFQLVKSAFHVFDQAWIDANGNGIYETGEQLLSAPGDIFLQNAFDGLEYTSGRDASPGYTIEERGPVRTVIRAAGSLRAAGGQSLTTFIVRLTAYADRDFVEVDYTLVDPRREANVNTTRSQLALSVAGYGIRLPVALPGSGYTFGGAENAIYAGPITGEHALFQTGAMNYINGSLQPFTFAYSGVGTGDKAAGWMDVSAADRGISVMLEDFWQEFPKELTVDPGQLTVWLHPRRASSPTPDLAYPKLDGATKRYVRPNTFYFPREGGAKTSRLLIRFHAGAVDAVADSKLNDAFQAGPRLEASAAWYARSGAFGDLLEAGPWSAGYDDWLISGVYQRSIAQVERTGGLTIPYGWRDYGDRMRPSSLRTSAEGVQIPCFYNDTHVGAHQFLVQYIRTLDRRWLKLGTIATRHWMDIDVSHADRWGFWKSNAREISLGPGEAHLVNHEVEDHSSRNLHPGHAHLSGLPDYYLLTGDRRALEVLN